MHRLRRAIIRLAAPAIAVFLINITCFCLNCHIILIGPCLAAVATPDAGRLPALTGSYVFASTQWHALTGQSLKTSSPFVSPQGGQEIALRIQGISPGRYYLRALVETGAGTGEEVIANSDAALLFLNGKAISFARATPIVPFQATNVAVIESEQPLSIRNGDEVRWNVAGRSGNFVGGVALSPVRLDFAPVDIPSIYDTDLDDQIRLTGSFTVPDRESAAYGKEPGNEGRFHYGFINVTGQSRRFTIKVIVLDFWQRAVAEQTSEVTLENRKDYAHELAFTMGDSDRYRAIVKISAPDMDKVQEFEKLVDNPAGARPRMWLNDGWQWCSVKDDGTTAARQIGDVSGISGLSGWLQADLPASWQETAPQDHVAWYRRSFTLPGWLNGKRLFAHFQRVGEEARVFVNGAEVGRHFGHSGPFEFEVTQAVRPGANDIVIGVRDGIATIAQSELAAARVEVVAGSQMRSPRPVLPVLAEMWLYGMPGMGGAAARITGAQPIRNVFVSTSFRRKEIGLQVQPPAFATGKKAVLCNRVLYCGREVLRFPDTPLTDASPATLELNQAWPDPILWNPGDPKLLQMVTEVKDAGGIILDRVDTRFGFREFWPEGTKMMWNGRPVKIVANSFLNSTDWGISYRSRRDFTRKMLVASKRFGISMQRHLADPEYRIEMNDEEGIPVAWELSGVVLPTQQVMQSDEFWKNAAGQNIEAVLGLRDHPSIVTWYLSNEFHGADTPANQERLKALGRAVAAVDTTRILEFGCDLDLGGFSSVISTHYPVDYPALNDERAFFPDAAYWHPIDKKLQPGQHVPNGIVKWVANVAGDSVITWGYKPIVINETLWNYFFSPPDGLTRLVGDAAYTSPSGTERAIKAASAWFVRGHRDVDAAIVEPWEWIYRDPVGTYFPPIDINPIQRYAHFFGGRQIGFDVNLNCDRFQPSRLTFSWRLIEGAVVLQKSDSTIGFASGELKRVRVNLNLPAVKARAQMRLELRLLENGAVLRAVTLPLDVCPRSPVSVPNGVRIGLYDPAGTARAVMGTFAGPAPRAVAALTAETLAGLDILIIGENAAGPDNAEGRRSVDDFVRGGGRALVLRQDKSPALLPIALNVTALVSSRLWSFYPGHPLFTGISPDDFSFWYPEHRVGGNLYVKPDAGNFRTLLESGGPKGMVYSALIEHPIGRGSIMLSQLDLTTHLAENPIAGQTWQALLDYMAKRPPPAPPAGFWGPRDNALYKSLTLLGAQTKPVSERGDLAAVRTLVLDGSSSLTPEQVASLHSFAQDGGHLLIHGVTPANREAVAAICGSAVRVTAPGPHSWDGRAIRAAQSDLSAGLNNYDLFWRHRPDTESYSDAYYKESSMLAPLGQWTLDAPKGRSLTYPAYVVEVPAGRGRILLDNIAWETPSEAVRDHTRHIASVLLTNFGVCLDAGAKLEVPRDLTYMPIDLSGVLNRSFTDDRAEDGQGGWTDQGPDYDLRYFPQDKPVRILDGVPFKIAKGNSVLVLQSPHIRGTLPDEIDLPVAGKADVLFFLQSEAWCDTGHQWSYIVHYANGADYEIRVSGGVNIRDWAAADPGAPFAFETDTVTHVAWTGRSEKFPKISLYNMAWPNPHPDLAIRGITARSMKQGIPVLVAITAATANVGSPVAVAPVTAEAVPAAIRNPNRPGALRT